MAVQFSLRYSSRVKRLRLEVVPGEVRVVAPEGVRLSVINAFVQSRESWIHRKTEGFDSLKEQFDDDGSGVFVLGDKLLISDCMVAARSRKQSIEKWLDERLLSYLTETLKKHDLQGLIPTRIRLGNAKTRWGSCSPKGVVMINRKLVHAPRDVVEYVFVHELVHLKHRNHSTRFWSSVHAILGDVKPQKDWLRLQGAFLLSMKGKM